MEGKKTGKLQLIKTTLLNSIGRELGRLIMEGDWKWKAMQELWEKGSRDERLIVISALGKLSKEYENTKQFILNIVDDVSSWEICV